MSLISWSEISWADRVVSQGNPSRQRTGTSLRRVVHLVYMRHLAKPDGQGAEPFRVHIMAKEYRIQKPLIEQILDEMFDDIKRRDEFDAQAILSLTELAKMGGLKKPQKLAKILKPVEPPE